MPLDFPTSPSPNDTYSFGGKTWIWTGEYWRLNTTGAINDIPIGNITASTGNFTTLSVQTGIASDLLPTANITYDLGSNSNRWNDLWLANSTIYIGNGTISANATSLVLTNPNGEPFSGGGGGTPGGSNTQIQFNDDNTFGGSPALTFDKVTNAVSITGTVTAQDFVTPVSVISSNTSATSGTLYVFTDTLTLTLPAGPAVGDSVFVSNRSNQTDCIIDRNSSNIMGSSENLQVNVLNAAFELVYVNPSQGWILL